MKLLKSTFLLFSIILLGCGLVMSPLYASQEIGKSINYDNRASYPLENENHLTAGLAVGDIDGDSDIDLIVANGRHWAQASYIYLNADNRGLTSRRVLGEVDRTGYTVKLVDIDGDDDLDIIQASDKLKNQLFINDGNGNFGTALLFGSVKSNTRSIQIADINSDGALDILEICRGTENLIFLNDGNGSFPTMRGDSRVTALSFGDLEDSTLSVEVADMNADNHLDLVLANRDQTENKILLNDGAMNFSTRIGFGSGEDDTRGVAVADMNGDGLLDIITANIGEANSVILNMGDDTYSQSQLFGKISGQSFAIVAEDLDGDNDIDIIIGNKSDFNRVYLNDGSGKLSLLAEIGNMKESTYAVAVGDINGDGRPDIISGNAGSPNFIHFQFAKKQ